ncbi:tumor necrosis factor receptor superfamily member 17 [Triplophysa dalaica]|uniref:tumor necrosis factor receptor superfamily member 17 n=1 Tax=Triplophysa dalaica TaxID=1582913 RepID=UPI0024DF3BDD|nr:tumor necrosis factor receptor superfamily member 17 [Triplophysa dalaica]
MILYAWLLLYIIFQAEGKCPKNYYYDGLLEECQPCSIRCNSPPTICRTYCTSIPAKEPEKTQNIHFILTIFFVFLGAFMVLTIILGVIRKKTCKLIDIKKVIGREQKTSVSERSLDATDKSTPYQISSDDGLSQHHYNSNLPLPSTEEGTTLLVTTKTVQSYHCTPVL